MRPILFFLILLLLVPKAASADQERLRTLEKAHHLLQAEYDLASRPRIYFVFDLPARAVRYKARGITLADLTMSRVRVWGDLGGVKLGFLAEKDSFHTPERETVKINLQEGINAAKAPGKQAHHDPPALELSDMPRAFQLRLDDGTRITVRPEPGGFFSRFWMMMEQGFWTLSRPLATVWNFLFDKPHAEVFLSLQARDAQRLYWALADGSACLLVQ